MINKFFRLFFLAVPLLIAQACSLVPSGPNDFYGHQDQALNSSRVVVLRELFITDEPLGAALVMLNERIKESESNMRIVFELKNGSLYPIDVQGNSDDRLNEHVDIAFTAIGLQDVIKQLVLQTKLDVVYAGDLIILNPSSSRKP